jgi:hypothetical protein
MILLIWSDWRLLGQIEEGNELKKLSSIDLRMVLSIPKIRA